MKIVQIAFLAITLTVGYSVSAQETKTTKIKSEENKLTSKEMNVGKLDLTPEQSAKNRAEELKSKVTLTEDQFASVKSLFLKIENRKSALTNLSDEEKSKATKELQAAEDRELNSILSPSQQKINSAPKSTTKTATNM